MADDILPESFIQAIKVMTPRERNKIRADRLIELILMKADIEDNSESRYDQIEN